MSEYEFIEEVSRYTKEKYGLTFTWELMDEGRGKMVPFIGFSLDRTKGVTSGSSNFKYYYGHLPFKEGVYTHVNGIINKYCKNE